MCICMYVFVCMSFIILVVVVVIYFILFYFLSTGNQFIAAHRII